MKIIALLLLVLLLVGCTEKSKTQAVPDDLNPVDPYTIPSENSKGSQDLPDDISDTSSLDEAINELDVIDE